VSALVPPPRIWFLDTASLLSMAVDDAVAAAVMEEIGDDRVVIIDVVTDELHYRATVDDTAELANTALADRKSDWTDLDTDELVTLDEVLDAQEDVADGRTLKDDYQHWAESIIIAMARQSAAAGSVSTKVLLSEDFDARRVADTVPDTTSTSIHGLLHHRIHVGKTMSPDAAAELAQKLHDAGRGPVVTTDDFADPSGRGLGRVGKPTPRL
jgi:hypothetical protein